ncbi:LacI family DNA-binding transcriptional regulator [Oenococcus sicerae]|uniref:LacI family DNA-binding transcriptional regulator n=1 Tax=Oenococcus sicerae TaxID=2203724 RepID=A0AAJ1VNF2_9LACO|nr:LacI family DNA-binding transcriptional regulator [Oenococcus sicerae]MDN6900696.1 LacI family DNA-binding transcriptional regulator [Oenococcus sicerae]
MEKLTIKDIARLVGVSTATVSYYLNKNYSKMSKVTREKIRVVIEETDYRPNSVARNLAKNENKMIGVSVADITNPFTSAVLSGIYDACGSKGYQVVFTNASGSYQREAVNINKLRQEEVSGLIIDPVDPDNPIYKVLSNDTSVMLDRQSDSPKIDTIVTDNFKSVSVFTNKMIKSGYEELFFVSWPLGSISTRVKRYEGFLDATQYANNDHLVTFEDTLETVDLQEKLQTIMHKFPNKKIGFFAMNGRVLIKLLHAMQDLRLSYPEDYGVGAYEDLEWMGVIKPGISCIHQYSYEIGLKSVDNILKKIESGKNTNAKPKLIVVATKMVIRKSY